VWISAFAAVSEPRSLAAVLEELRATGVQVLYSSDLVTPDMKIVTPLQGGDAMARAREALAAHGLILQKLDSNYYVVTRAPPAPAPPSQNADSRPEPPPALAEVSVYASRYALGAGRTGEPSFLSSTDIEQVPGSQNDALRATRVLPGIATNGSSRPYIRGSLLDDVLVQFDGVPLADPFHLKNFQSLISAFDASAVDRIEVFSGGFPVRYGTRSGGVIDIAPRTVSSGYEHSVGVSLLTYNLSTVGHGDRWPVDWLATIRHSTKDVVIKPVNGEVGEPQFTDTLGRVRWRFSDSSSWTAGWLLLDDRIQLATENSDELATAQYRDEYGWLAFDHDSGARVHSRTVLVVTHAERTRGGNLTIPDVSIGHLDESRSFNSLELRSDWTYQPAPYVTWSYGLEASHATAELQYDRSGRFSDPIAASFARPADNTFSARAAPEATTYALYGAVRRRWSSIEAELGVRLDAQDYKGFASLGQVSPRLNVRYDIRPHWRVYGSWGRFTQAQRVDEWRIEEAQFSPDEPQLALHTILGLAYERSEATRFTLEVYRKRWSNVSPYFDNLLDKLSLLPDLEPDRVRVTGNDSESAGVELSMRRALTPSLEVWGSYTWSRVADEFGAEDVLRSWDQPHAVTVGLGWSAGRRSASALVGWHRGWPRTPFTWTPAMSGSPAEFAVGARNSARWGNYFTVDLRAGWTIPMGRGELATWAELTNSANRDNDCCVSFVSPQTTSGLRVTRPNFWLPRILNVGVTWRFRAR
jgi:outer membrane cobalamin receptor